MRQTHRQTTEISSVRTSHLKGAFVNLPCQRSFSGVRIWLAAITALRKTYWHSGDEGGVREINCLQKNHQKTCQIQNESPKPRSGWQQGGGVAAPHAGSSRWMRGIAGKEHPLPQTPSALPRAIQKQSGTQKCCTCVAYENKSLTFCTMRCKEECVCVCVYWNSKKSEQKLWTTSVPPEPCFGVHLAALSTFKCSHVLWLALCKSVILGLAGTGEIRADKWRSFACSGTWSWWLYQGSLKSLYVSYWSAW